MVAFARLDRSRPPGDHGHAYSAIVEGALVAAQRSTRIKEAHFVASLVVRSVVGSEDDKGVLLDAQFLKQIEDLAHVLVHERDHGGEALFRFGPILLFVDSVAGNFLTVPLGLVVGVGDVPSQVEVEGVLVVSLDEGECFLGQPVMGVGHLFG